MCRLERFLGRMISEGVVCTGVLSHSKRQERVSDIKIDR
jgi:hypothetical protein